MSSSLCTHVGPYMVVNKLKSEGEETYPVCGIESCTKFEKKIDSKYCPECGETPINNTFPIEIVKDVRDITHSITFTDELVSVHAGGCEISEDYTVLIPNEYVPNGLSLSDCDADICEIKPDRMKGELEWFMEKYTEIISTIISEFGESNVKIKWGVVLHYN